jgi:toxin ParE1/3/4
MKVRYTRPALADLDDILTYLARHSPTGTSNVQARIQSVIELLSRHPGIGTLTDDPTIRKLPATPYRYLVFYEVGDTDIIIHAIRHGARDPTDMPGR